MPHSNVGHQGGNYDRDSTEDVSYTEDEIFREIRIGPGHFMQFLVTKFYIEFTK